jgi:hypothetical protein
MLVWRLNELMAPRTRANDVVDSTTPCLPSTSGTPALGVLNLTLEGKRLGRWIYSIISPSGSEMATSCFPNAGIRSSILSWETLGRPTIAHAGMDPSGRCAKEHDAPAAARSAAGKSVTTAA